MSYTDTWVCEGLTPHYITDIGGQQYAPRPSNSEVVKMCLKGKYSAQEE